MKKIIPIIITIIAIILLFLCFVLNTNQSSKSIDSSNSSDYTYVSSFEEVNTGVSDYITILANTDEGIYATYRDFAADLTPEGVIPEYEEQYWVYEDNLLFIDNTGTTHELDSYKPVLYSSNDNEQKYDYSVTSYLLSMVVQDNGKLYCIESVDESWVTYDGLEPSDVEYWDNYEYHTKYFLRVLDKNGNELSICEIPLGEDEYINSSIVFDKDDNILLSFGTSLRAITLDGEEIYSVSTNNNYIDSICSTNDGRIFVTMWLDGKNETIRELKSNHTLGLPKSIPDDAYSFYTGSNDYPLYYSNGKSLYGYNPDDGTNEKLFSWVNLDIDGNNLNSISIKENGVINCIVPNINSDISNYYLDNNININGENTSIIIFTIEKKLKAEVQDKKELVLATENLSYDVMNEIIKYNISNDEYKIFVRDYSEYNTSEDYNLGIKKIKQDIKDGNAPDIIDFSFISPSLFVSNGCLLDLYSFMDEDPLINKEDFFDSVLKACEIDGKLYTSVSNFYIKTATAPKSLVGNRSNWTFDDFKKVYDSVSDDCNIFDECYTRDDIIATLLTFDINDFINWSTGEIDFDNDEFRNIINFASLFPEYFDWDQYNELYEVESIPSRINSGKQLLYETYLNSIEDIPYIRECFDGLSYTYIGMPVALGSGSAFGVESTCFGITTNCKYPNEAWNFVRIFFTEEYMSNNYYFPLNINLFEKKLSNSMEINYQTDLDGNYIIDDNGEKNPQVIYSYYDCSGNLIDIYSISEEEAESIRNLISSTDKVLAFDEDINNIIIDKLQTYYSGRKSLDSTIETIQLEVQSYISNQF